MPFGLHRPLGLFLVLVGLLLGLSPARAECTLASALLNGMESGYLDTLARGDPMVLDASLSTATGCLTNIEYEFYECHDHRLINPCDFPANADLVQQFSPDPDVTVFPTEPTHYRVEVGCAGDPPPPVGCADSANVVILPYPSDLVGDITDVQTTCDPTVVGDPDFCDFLDPLTFSFPKPFQMGPYDGFDLYAKAASGPGAFVLSVPIIDSMTCLNTNFGTWFAAVDCDTRGDGICDEGDGVTVRETPVFDSGGVVVNYYVVAHRRYIGAGPTPAGHSLVEAWFFLPPKIVHGRFVGEPLCP